MLPPITHQTVHRNFKMLSPPQQELVLRALGISEQIEELKNKNSDLQRRNIQLRSETSDLQDRNKGLSNEIRRLKKQAPPRSGNLSLKAEIQTLQRKVEELETENRSLQQQLKSRKCGRRGPYKSTQSERIRKLRDEKALSFIAIGHILNMKPDTVSKAYRRHPENTSDN